MTPQLLLWSMRAAVPANQEPLPPHDEEIGYNNNKSATTTAAEAESRDDVSQLSSLDHNNNNNNNDTTTDAHQQQTGAEGIVRAEAKTVRNLRLAVMILIGAAATACGIFIYKLSSKNENDAFKYSFDEAATKLTQTFISALSENLNYAFILSVAMSSGIYADSDYVPSFPNLTISQFDALTYFVRTHGIATSVTWSPLLNSRQEKDMWEEYALGKLVNHSNTNNSPAGSNTSQQQYPPCYMCGEGYEFSNPAATLAFPGIGTITCEKIEFGALGGYVGPSQCSYSAPIVQPVCGCQKSNTEGKSNSSLTLAESAQPSAEGIFWLNNGTAVIDQTPPPYSPIWQIAPSPNTVPATMFNQMSEPARRQALHNMIDLKIPAFSTTVDPSKEQIYSMTGILTYGAFVSFFYPVFESVTSTKLVGSINFDLPWLNLFNKQIPANSNGVSIVLENTLGQTFTYLVDNEAARFVGPGDLHDATFDSLMIKSTFEDFDRLLLLSTPPQVLTENWSIPSKCSYRIRVYPSKQFRNDLVTNKPVIYTSIVVLAFLVTSLVFYAYDCIVRRLQDRVLDSAKRSEAIVSSLFPALVRDRLFGHSSQRRVHQPSDRQIVQKRNRFDFSLINHKARLTTFLSHPPSLDICNESDPIADLYPNTTVMFADIAGFTAWSSEREPPQVFKLLESLYSEFDEIARELGVFKVETIGDCYVAVTGLPEKMKHHAVVMVEFACRCLVRMHELVSQLELILGPGTADLTMRVGLHSGPVTAGVLRSERARFQLFGDTINVASRMESTGMPNKVQISTETANLLVEAGKELWISRRKEFVSVKGKGMMETYWAKPLPLSVGSDFNVHESHQVVGGGNHSHPGGASVSLENVDVGAWGCTSIDNTTTRCSLVSRRDRLVQWNTDLLYSLLQKVVVKRNSTTKLRASKVWQMDAPPRTMDTSERSNGCSSNVQFVNEIADVIEMPCFDERFVGDPNSIDLGPEVRSQLQDYVGFIASMYRDNAFHNFEHACHVAMSASKLVKRIIAPDNVNYKAALVKNSKNHKNLSKEIHEMTFGISSDPLMQFAVVFSALIHDVDHTGLPNQQLVKENDPIAVMYHGKCVAEQRSLQVAWDKLMEDRFADLRRCLYQTEQEKQRFRQLLVNAVIATDIGDKDLSLWRKNRWDKVFHQEPTIGGMEAACDRKATIVFEYIIQASDVAHTMQHWHVYLKWNKRLFHERYTAYLAGHEAEDPSIGWQQGEIWFFDNYIIPLAKKLEECNVFGVSCDEYLTYALQNRLEWELKGDDIVQEMVSNFVDGDDDDYEKVQ